MTKSAIAVVLVVLIAIVGAFVYLGQSNSDDVPADGSTSQPESSSSNGNQQQDSSQTDGQAVTIIYSNSGFEKPSYAIPAGTEVTVQNASDEVLQFSSDDHPAHTDNNELNIEPISSGQSTTFTPTETGEWGFHNHLNASHTGSLIVE